MTLIDFFLWVCEKYREHSEIRESLDHLKTRIQLAINTIDTSTLANVWKHINTKINCVVCEEVRIEVDEL